MDSIEFPVIEDHCTLQLVLAHVLKQMVNSNIDHRRAGMLLYGLQIAAKTINGSRTSTLDCNVKSITRTREGDDLAPEKITCEPGYDSCDTCPRAEICPDYDPENTSGPDED
jgi:hypothetical protein